MNDAHNARKPSFSTRAVPMAQLSAQAAEEMPIRRADWRRIKGRVERLGKPSGGTMGFNFMLLFLSSAVSAVLALFALVAATEKQDTWVQPVFITTTIFFVVAAFVCWLWHRDMKGRIQDDVSMICEDMDQMERDYESSVGAPPETSPTSS